MVAQSIGAVSARWRTQDAVLSWTVVDAGVRWEVVMTRGTIGCALSLALLLTALGAGPTFADDGGPKVVIIGFDGADARLVEQWMDQGELPNLARLRDEGTYAPLLPTNPPQTPVSWSSFATGTDPGKTQIFDFLRRDPENYLPDFALLTEGRKPFLFGERNPLILGLAAGVAALIVSLAATLLIRMRWVFRLGLGLVIAVAAGLPAAAVASRYLPTEVPDATNNRRGTTMWELAADAGLKALVVRVPATFPAEPIDGGHMLSGLGVPDMRGRVGTPAFYTSDPAFQGGDNEFSLELIRLHARRGTLETKILGPRNKPFYDYVIDRRTAEAAAADRREVRRRVRRELDEAEVPSRIDLDLQLEVTDTTATVRVGEDTATLGVGEWSDWIVLDFPVNPLVDRAAPLRGTARFKLLQLEPELQLYMSPINFHPDCHPVAFAWPPDYSGELMDRFGLYKTLGWALDTWSLPSGVGDEELFLEDMEFTVGKYEQIMEGLLAEEDPDLYVQIFYFTDRIGHLFWRLMDPGHPLYDQALAAKYGGQMLEAYRRMDRIVGRARELAGPDALFIVCSDHGFSSFRRGVNINNWLVEQGLMTLKNVPGDKATLEQLFDTRELFENVDWSKTKAYALGLGSIYVNLIGRERYGQVLPGPEYEEVRRQIKEGLEALVDPETGEHPVSRVWTREAMYSEFDARVIPDLRAANSLNYRVSWQTTLGGFGESVVEDNLKAWSGDHCSNEPELVHGIFFASRPINTSSPRMIDIMPSVLHELGIDPPAEVDGASLYGDRQ
jgi:predicted AlkP superfamily phosphohydrolase/phosphomutase